MSRHKPLFLLAAVVLAMGPAHAQTRANLEVVAHILPRTSVALHHQRSLLHVSADDIRRGYVQVADAVRVAVRTNVSQGATLDVSSPLQWVARIEVQGADGSAAAGSQFVVPLGAHEARLVLRVYLAPGTVPGAYPFAVQIAQDA